MIGYFDGSGNNTVEENNEDVRQTKNILSKHCP